MSASESTTSVGHPPVPKPAMNVFERFLTLWVALCIVVGIVLGQLMPGVFHMLGNATIAQVNLPVAVLVWLMIVPMLLKIDPAALREVGQHWRGIASTVGVNWLVKPFSMALLAWVFIAHLFRPYLPADQISSYTAGLILLAAAPCTAMVFVWSYLSDGDPAYTLVQVSINDLVMLIAFAPIVKFLVTGAAGLEVPFRVLLDSVLIFVVIPLVLGAVSRIVLTRLKGAAWFEQQLLPRFAPMTIVALLATLVLIFAFQADNITARSLHVVLIAVPILLQVYFNSAITYALMRLFRVPYAIAAPGALIGASNFFELAVATAIALYGPGSGAALATVVGVLVEVPVMLSVCRVCVATRGWFGAAVTAPQLQV